jgi:hypothetical protein
MSRDALAMATCRPVACAAASALLLAGALGCSRHADEAQSTPRASSAASDAGSFAPSPLVAPGFESQLATPIEATLNGKAVRLTHGLATFVNGLWLQVQLYSEPINCTAGAASPRVTFDLGRGPENRYFVGDEVPTEASVFAPGTKVSSFQGFARVRLDAVGKVRADDVAGRVILAPTSDADKGAYALDAKFHVPICADVPTLPELSATVPALPIRGTLGALDGRSGSSDVQIRSVAARVSTVAGIPRLVDLMLSPDEDVSCARPQGHDILRVTVLGVAGKETPTGRPMPASATLAKSTDAARAVPATVGQVGWVSFHKVVLDATGLVTGELAIDNAQRLHPVKLAGHFAAKVCPFVE